MALVKNRLLSLVVLGAVVSAFYSKSISKPVKPQFTRDDTKGYYSYCTMQRLDELYKQSLSKVLHGLQEHTWRATNLFYELQHGRALGQGTCVLGGESCSACIGELKSHVQDICPDSAAAMLISIGNCSISFRPADV